jgi:anti-sigma factor ChrR (cupin superfamily)
MDHPLDKLHDLFFERLTPEERGAVLAHLRGCAACAARLDALAAAVAAVPPAEPSAALRSRLLRSVDHLERFAPFAPRLAELVALSANDARRALHALSEASAWPPGRCPGMRALRFAPGAARAHVTAILACFAPGASVPRHRHVGHEVILVFQGAFETEDGRVVTAGEELHSPPGSAHRIPRILGDVDCLCVIVNDGPVESDDGEPSEPPPALDACPGGTS